MTVCLLLAAGSSSRMGKPKMLLTFNNKTFLQHIIDETKKLSDAPLLVVTGCYHSLTAPILTAQNIPYIENKNWQEGMGSSIQTGVEYILSKYPDTENIIITVCDQPHISFSLFNKLIEAHTKTGKNIIASTYNGTAGTPVLFGKKYFEQLRQLKGQYGAKKIIQQFSQDVFCIDFPEGATDIDTPEDYKAL
jgi:molybdenum cofactor cytidylyltransferase